MNKESLKKVSLIGLANLMEIANEENNQEMINLLALEVADRLYVPNPNKTREEFLVEFGYKEIKKEKPKEKRK